MLIEFIKIITRDLQREGIPMDKFSAIVLPESIFRKVQKEYIDMWGKGVVKHDLNEIEGIQIVHRKQYRISENQIHIYSYPLCCSRPIKRVIILPDTTA